MRTKNSLTGDSAATSEERKSARKQRSDGEKSRGAILVAAAQLASVRGLDGLSIGDLASNTGMSKSGLFAHFKSKEELQLATIEYAMRVFDTDVIEPALKRPAGLPRFHALVDGFLSHLKRRVFAGGCFFASVSAKLDGQPGRPRDRILQYLVRWTELIDKSLRDAKFAGDLHAKADIAQLGFEARSMLLSGNFAFVVTGDASMLRRAKAGVKNLLERAAEK